MEHLARGGSIKDRTDVPDWAKNVYVTAPDISPSEHVNMQAAFQDSVDAGISKTINFANNAEPIKPDPPKIKILLVATIPNYILTLPKKRVQKLQIKNILKILKYLE